MKSHRLSILSTAALIWAALLWALSATGAEVTPKAVAAWRIPGEREAGHCLEYALCLTMVLTERGIESRVVAADWNDQPIGHAVVLFRIGSQWHIIDNEQDKATAVTGSTDLERVRCFLKDADSVRPDPCGTLDAEKIGIFLGRLGKARAKYHY